MSALATGLTGGTVVVFDAETDSGFDNLRGFTHAEKIGRIIQPTVVCATTVPSALVLNGASAEGVLEHATHHVYWRDVAEDGKTPFDELFELFDRADVIVGYNSLNFDFPLLRRFYRAAGECSAEERYLRHRYKSLDVFARVRDGTGAYYKLDALLKLNGLAPKTADGAQAVVLWSEGRREELRDYCAADVVCTLRLSMLDFMSVGYGVRVPGHVFNLRNQLLSLKAQRSF
jgi:hypothetical protein